MESKRIKKPVGRPPGIPKTGGRGLGVCNKENEPIKGPLKQISMEYVQPNPENEGGISDLQKDLRELPPAERVNAHIRILEFTTPRMKATEVTASVAGLADTLEMKLAQLAEE